MGGGAFLQASSPSGEPTLNTPRLSREEYKILKEIHMAKLRDYLPNDSVACLIEAPEKADYGDIDVVVAVDQRVDFISLANHLGATGIIYHSESKSQKCILGVPKDGSASSRPVVEYQCTTEQSDSVTEEEFAQIDVEIITPSLLDWFPFYSSYGDMSGLLGRIVKNLGFTVSDQGFWLRMKELDESKTLEYHVGVADKDGMLLLSKDSAQVMRFLGLSVERFEVGFDTLDGLFTWLSTCRLLSANAIKLRPENSSERNRKDKRIVYTRFFYEWLPNHMEMDFEQDRDTQEDELARLRQKWLEEALDFFSKREEYTAKHEVVVLKVKNAAAENLLKPIIAQHSCKMGKSLNEIMRAFRRYVGFTTDGQPCVVQTPHSDTSSQLYRFLGADGSSLRDPQGTSRWVQEKWEELKALERQRAKGTGWLNCVSK